MNQLLLPMWVNFSILFAIIAVFVTIFSLIFPVLLWIKTVTSKCRVSLWKLYAIKLRKSDPKNLVEAYINCSKSGIDLTIDELEAHFVAGGDVIKLTDALIMAKSAKVLLTVDLAKSIDLSGNNVVEAVKNTISPKVVETSTITAVAKDGYEIKVRARITIRANIEKLIGGATEETVISKISEAIMTEIGKSIEYKDFMQKPDVATGNINLKEIEKNCAYNILSVNISFMELGKNLEALTLLQEAETDRKIADEKAAERKAMAVAAEQEMKVKTQEMRAELLASESEVPKAIASAMQTGNIGVLDYYKMQNLLADTGMRKKFSEDDSKKQ